MEKGPTYREKQKIDWEAIRTEIKTGLTQCKRDWAKLENANPVLLDVWIGTVMTKVDAEITSLTTRPTKHVKKILKQKQTINELNQLQDKYVFVPTDKASNNISVVCKQFYIQTMMDELKVFDDDTTSNTYEKVREFSRVEEVDDELSIGRKMTPELKIEDHKKDCKKWNIHVDDTQAYLPFMYWVPKMHKKTK